MKIERGGFPEGLGKRYETNADLERFYSASEERYDELFPHVKLGKLVKEFQSQPHTKDVVTRTWSGVWDIAGKVVGTEVAVTECDRTDEEIAELEKAGRMLIYVPKEVSEIEHAKKLLALALPDPRSHEHNSLSRHSFINIVEQSGWISVEATPKLPHSRPQDETTIRRRVENGELQGQTVNTYLIATVFSKLTTGSYFGEGDQYPYTDLIIGSRMNDKLDGKPAQFIPYAQSSKDVYRNQGILFWSWGGRISPRQIRTAELKDPKAEQQDRNKYRWDMNVLQTPPTAREWDKILERDTGAQVAKLLEHIHSPEGTLLPLEKALPDVNHIAVQALSELSIDVKRTKTVSAGSLQRELTLGAGHIDRLLGAYVRSRYDVGISVSIGIEFFDKLFRDGLRDKVPRGHIATDILWRAYKSLIKAEVDLLANSRPTAASKITPLRELCEAGNYPVGLDRDRTLIIVTR